MAEFLNAPTLLTPTLLNGDLLFFWQDQENTTIYLCAFGFLKKESKTKTFGHMATLIISRRD